MLEIGPLRESQPAHRPRPQQLPGYHRFQQGEFEAFVSEAKVLRKIQLQARQSKPFESIGWLMGRVFSDLRGDYLIVTEVLLAEESESRPCSVSTTSRDCLSFLKASEQEHPTLDLVGWYHSHPLDLHEYSATDKRNQQSWQQPYQLGLLVVVGSGPTTIHAFHGPGSERMEPAWIARDADHWRTLPPHFEQVGEDCPKKQLAVRDYSVIQFFMLVFWPLVFFYGNLLTWHERILERSELTETVEQLRVQVSENITQTQQQQAQLSTLQAARRGGDLQLTDWIEWLSHSLLEAQGDLLQERKKLPKQTIAQERLSEDFQQNP